MAPESLKSSTRLARALDAVERVGNRLPDPALLFLIMLVLVWITSALLAPVDWSAIDPRTSAPIEVRNLLTGQSFTSFMAQLVQTFVTFHPLGVVLVAMLGIGVAEHTGMISAALRGLLSVTSRALLTPMLIMVGILSHTAVDAGYVLVVPLGAVIYQAAGRHPLAGIAAAFAGVSGGFSATFIPSSLDPLLQGITQAAGQVLDPTLSLNPLNNYFFTTVSAALITGLGWFITDRIVEPRLMRTHVDGDAADAPALEHLAPQERRALRWALLSMAAGLVLLAVTAVPENSPWRAPDGRIAAANAPLMQSIVALIFLTFIVPGVVYGYLARTVTSHRDIVAGMSKSMSGMGYYIVMAFFAAQFIAAVAQSNLGALIAIEGAHGLRVLGMPPQITLIGIVLITGFVNLLVGSASAKWALLAPILVPMLMSLGISPDLTQAAYRIGDSSTNIITPLMQYFPVIIAFAQRYDRDSGLGTLISTMLPYTIVFVIGWSIMLTLWVLAGIPLGPGAPLQYAP